MTLTRFFPLFIDLSGKPVLMIGGGKIAERRIKSLASFGADITLISPKATEYIRLAAIEGGLRWVEREYQKGDIAGIAPFFVITAADDRQANHQAMTEAASLSIPISVADCREECTFYFPAIAENESYIAGIVSKNGDHAGVKSISEDIRGMFNR